MTGIKKEKIIDKDLIRQSHGMQYGRLNKMFGSDWMVYQTKTNCYELRIGDYQTSFISMKLDFDNLIDGIAMGILLGKDLK